MKYSKIDCDGYNIHTIKTNRFRNCHIEIIFRNNIKKDEITKRAMLTDILAFSSKQYYTKRILDMELENLYNSYFYSSTSRVGGCIISNFSFDFLNPSYCEEGSLEKFVAFPFEILNNPNIKNGEFNLNSFNIVKNRLESDIKSIKDNSKKYSIIEMLKGMDKDAPISYQISGYLKDLDNITPKNLAAFYNTMLEDDYCDVFIIGNLDMKQVVKLIKENFKIDSIKKHSLNLNIQPKIRTKINKIFKNEEYNQANLVVGCNIINMTKLERTTTINVLNAILGGGSLDDKLAKYLRKDNSLCYTVTSFAQKYDNVLIIHAGIDSSKYNLAVKLIKKALKELQKGNITKKELNNAIKINVNSLKSVLDNESALITSYLFNHIDNIPLFEERIELVKKTTINDIVALAKKIKINTINFVYKGAK